MISIISHVFYGTLYFVIQMFAHFQSALACARRPQYMFQSCMGSTREFASRIQCLNCTMKYQNPAQCVVCGPTGAPRMGGRVN